MKCLSSKWFLSSVTWLLLCNCLPIKAQVIPDTSLPSNSTVRKPDNINIIEGGAKAGSNLFHSFQEFSVPTGEIANFNNALDIQNIISRVTGKSISNIDGLIKANGTANLFLINPNGIIFGQNARLDIGGSFLASTGNSFKFADGTEFSTFVHQTKPLLTVSVPVGLQYGNNPGGIQVLGSNLEVPNGKGITLVGGNVSIDGGKLRVPGGRVELGSLAAEGNITFSTDAPQGLSFPQGVPRLDVSIINQAEINTLAPLGGSISIYAQNLNVLGGSQILTGISDVGLSNSHAGDININGKGGNINITAGSVAIKNSQLVANTQSEGDAGNITINTDSLDISNRAFITSSANGLGSAGNITINARGNVSINKGSIFSNVGDNQFCTTVGSACRDVTKGNGGNININALSLNLINGSFLATGVGDNLQNKRTEGNGGNISIKLRDSFKLDKSFVTSQVFSNGVGNGGQIDIQANSISSYQSAIAASTQGRGNAGGVSLQAIDDISASDSDISTAVQKGAVGNAQGINIAARGLFLTNGAQLNAVTSDSGKAGNILINTTDEVNISGTNTIVTPTNLFKNDITRRYTSPPEFVDGVTSGVFTSTNTSGLGGDITVNTKAFNISNGAVMDARTTASGKGGTININADTIDVKSGGQLTAITSADGTAGNINLNASKIAIFSGSDSTFQNRLAQFGAQTDIYSKLKVPNQVNNQQAPSGLFVNSSGSGLAGDLIANASLINLDNKATFSVDTKGGGGNINLNSQALLMRFGGNITTNATGINITGGNISLDTYVIAAFNNSDITANSEDFRGGNIRINTRVIFGIQFRDALTSKSDITATGANSQLSGDVQISTPDINPTSGLVELAVDVVDRSRLIAQGCPAKGGNTFTITGRGGIPSLPSELLHSDRPVSVGWVTIDKQRQPAQISTHNLQLTEIIEATSFAINKKGEVMLTAPTPLNTSNYSSC